ncbi:uncharacterized protein LOC116849742 [Odontomachus brunneus]|uniref:uncharacterized protein LOC116849742 n=1 Tax=Odontomachus brunneus TaxID=486640 RepID=UPI0013F26D25|nr:uncharacterized protein LOC116849742 [Odontomachus brunneus]
MVPNAAPEDPVRAKQGRLEELAENAADPEYSGSVGLIGNRIDLCSIHQRKIRAKNLDSMMMANLAPAPVMLPTIADYGMLPATLGIKVSAAAGPFDIVFSGTQSF